MRGWKGILSVEDTRNVRFVNPSPDFQGPRSNWPMRCSELAGCATIEDKINQDHFPEHHVDGGQLKATVSEA